MQFYSAARLSLLPLVFVLCCSSALPVQAAETRSALKITGSTTVEKALLEPNRERIRKEMGIELDLQCKGSGPGLLRLAHGLAEVSATSETLADTIDSAAARAVADRDPIAIPNNLVYSEILHERVVVIVNAKNTRIKQLNKEQLAAIFTQKTVNWERVGGNDQYITVFISPVGAATRALFQKVIMNGAEFPNDDVHNGGIMMPVSSTARAIDSVATVPDSIAAVSESALNQHPRKADVRIVEAPVMDHPLGFITLGKPTPNIQALIDFLRQTDGKVK
jgi:phosphate transport system substrate-binding protein